MHRSLFKWLGSKLYGSRRRWQTSNSSCRKSSSGRLCCDVFINHRGKDTKRSIAALLYERFVHLNLNPFLDYKSMKPGEELLETIESAIRECKVGVVIFSPHYCHSYFCLHELALMIQCQKKLIPIFYDVNPSHLVLLDDATYSPNELHKFRWALELAKRRVGIHFDSCNGNWPDLLQRASNCVVEVLMELDAEAKKVPASKETEFSMYQNFH